MSNFQWQRNYEFETHTKLEGELDAEQVLRSVLLMLDHRISEGEIVDVRQAMPEEVRDLWP